MTHTHANYIVYLYSSFDTECLITSLIVHTRAGGADQQHMKPAAWQMPPMEGSSGLSAW
jgi:hypothetical protein